MSENLAARRRGEAMAMQWVGFALQKIIADTAQGGNLANMLLGEARSVGGEKGTSILKLGCAWTQNVVLAFAVELSLKALLVKQDGHHEHTHKLVDLYDKLSEETQNKIESEYLKALEEGGSKSDKSLIQLLTDHQDDFVEWRYLDNVDENLDSEPNELQLAICAILNVYEVIP